MARFDNRSLNEDQAMEVTVERLVAATQCSHSRETVESLVYEAMTHFQHARVRHYLPILVERRVKNELVQHMAREPRTTENTHA